LSSVSFSCSMPESLAAPPGTSPIICCAPVSLRVSSLMPMPAVLPALAMAHPRRGDRLGLRRSSLPREPICHCTN
jgi:hypothetical protein